MKRIAVCIIVLLVQFSASAQIRGAWPHRGSFHIYTNLSADYNINSVDILRDSGTQKGVITTKNNLGTRIGFDLVRITRHRIYISGGFDFRIQPEKITINYVARDMGFTGSSYEYHEDRSFTNLSIETKGRIGYSIKMKERGAVDLAIGFTLSMPLKGKADTGYVLFKDISNTGYKDPLFFSKTGWGTKRAEVYSQNDEDPKMLFLFNFQAAYRFLQPAIFSDRSMRIGLDFSYMPSPVYNNRTDVVTYGPNRTNQQRHQFSDKHFVIGLFLGVEL